VGPWWCIFCTSRTDSLALNVEVDTLNGDLVGHSDLHTPEGIDAIADTMASGQSAGQPNPGDPMEGSLFSVFDGGNVWQQSGLMQPRAADWAFAALHDLIDSHNH